MNDFSRAGRTRYIKNCQCKESLQKKISGDFCCGLVLIRNAFHNFWCVTVIKGSHLLCFARSHRFSFIASEQVDDFCHSNAAQYTPALSLSTGLQIGVVSLPLLNTYFLILSYPSVYNTYFTTDNNGLKQSYFTNSTNESPESQDWRSCYCQKFEPAIKRRNNQILTATD